MVPSMRRSLSRVDKLMRPIRAILHRQSSSAGTAAVSPLSIPPSDADLPIESGAPDPQEQCSLLTKLPFEIRDLIYEHVYSDCLIHLVDLGARLGHIRCQRPVQDTSRDGRRHGADGLANSTIIDAEQGTNDKLLALCQTCRTLRNEALPYIYSNSRFTIHQPNILLTPSPPKSITRISHLDFEISFYRFPQITNNSRDISMPSWKRICHSLSLMPSLSDLCVTIRQTFFFVDIKGTTTMAELVVGVLRPLKTVRVQKRGQVKGERFEVRIGWRLTEEETELLGQVPFQLVELGERA